jgi:enoyl-CoA hydratase/carnithine racemase
MKPPKSRHADPGPCETLGAPNQFLLGTIRKPPEWRETLASFDTYNNSFPHAKLTRSSNGVLEVVLHTDGDTLVFNGYTHTEFVELFHQIGADADNRVVILTGAGRAFIDNIDPEGFDFFTPRGFDKIYREGKKLLWNILDISAPLIVALNGPATVHSEYALLADIIFATPDTIFQDKPHLNFGIVPGDGVHSLWQEVIGPIRGRTFLLTQQIIGADEAKTLGVISEIVPRDRLMDRAREVAAQLTKLPPLTTSYARVAFTQKLRRLVDESVGYGLALEGISAADVARMNA